MDIEGSDLGVSIKDRIRNTKTYKNFENDNASCNDMPEEERPKIEYNENGTIKRNGFSMGRGTINYGEDWERETFEKNSKSIIICLILFFLIAMAIIIFTIHYCVTTPNANLFIKSIINH